MRRSEITAEARSWVGTRFRHQGRTRGVAVDCAGVILGVARAFNVDCEDIHGYGREPVAARVKQILDRYALPVKKEDARPGDILLLSLNGERRHMGIMTERGIVHAWSGAGKVVEHRIDSAWRGRIKGAYRLPGVED